MLLDEAVHSSFLETDSLPPDPDAGDLSRCSQAVGVRNRYPEPFRDGHNLE
jgi:hypothetical protein